MRNWEADAKHIELLLSYDRLAESGRAGRDGAPCISLLYASAQDMTDLHKLEKGTRRGAVQAMNDYALSTGCRWVNLYATVIVIAGPDSLC